jgi:transmembrane sensor
VLLVAAAASFAVIRQLHGGARVSVATGAGEKRTITLADGSRIVVAPLSRVEMAGDRSARLVGEAYFVVMHDSSRPFRVETGDATIEDLGTSFVVRAGSGPEPTFVAVQEGVVSLAPAASRRGTDALILREGESGLVSTGRAVRADSATWSHALAWTRGEIVFDEMPLRDVAREINRWFGITVLLSDSSLERRTFTARLTGESLDDVLEAIDRSLGLRHTRTDDTVVFQP